MPIHEHDQRRRYCRSLGHEVPFAYCRKVGAQGLPCRNLLDCWYEHFDIGSFVKSNYTKDQIRAFLSPPVPKIASLVKMVEEAKRRIEAEQDEQASSDAPNDS